MPVATLTLESTPGSFTSFFASALDTRTNLRVIVASADQYARISQETAGLPGIYVLQAENSAVYVGQSKDLSSRLATHRSKRKIGYTKVMVMVRDQSLAMHLDYAEAKLYDMLSECGFALEQTDLARGLKLKQQRLAAISREQLGVTNDLLSHFFAYCIALGLAPPAKTPELSPHTPTEPGFALPAAILPPAPAAEPPLAEAHKSILVYSHQAGCDAKGRYEENGTVTVLAGSVVNAELKVSAPTAAALTRKRLLEQGQATESEGRYTFLTDVPCSSPSAAASLCTGSSANGWDTWQTVDKQSLGKALKRTPGRAP